MSGRIVFANQLRGIAAVAVAASHLGGVYWLIRPAVTAATFTPPLQGPNPPFTAFFLLPWFNLGPLGVGLFFLISGLVIPISLEKHKSGNFLLARVLRIYPTYVAALLIEVAAVYGNARYWGYPFGHSVWTVVSNCLLIQDLVGQPSIDLVNWTLCIELRFYLAMALVASGVRRGSVPALLAIVLLALGLNLAVVRLEMLGPSTPDPLLLSYTVSVEALFIVFMLIGVLFNYHLRGLLGTAALIAWVGVFGALFILCWRTSAIAAQYPWVTKNYGYALALFAGLYALRRWVPDSRALDALAAISFPLYLVHSLIGYSILKLLMLSCGWSYPASLAVSVAGVALLATGLHKLVETPTMRMGQMLALRTRQFSTEPVPAGAAEP